MDSARWKRAPTLAETGMWWGELEGENEALFSVEGGSNTTLRGSVALFLDVRVGNTRCPSEATWAMFPGVTKCKALLYG
jgi:hypothetical protein